MASLVQQKFFLYFQGRGSREEQSGHSGHSSMNQYDRRTRWLARAEDRRVTFNVIWLRRMRRLLLLTLTIATIAGCNEMTKFQTHDSQAESQRLQRKGIR